MEAPNHTALDEQTGTIERRTSHWQPAFRPSDDELEQHEQSQPHSAVSPGNAFEKHQEPNDEQSDGSTKENRIDPAWGISRTATSSLLDGVHRSPSFPMPEYHNQATPPSTHFSAQADQLVAQSRDLSEEQVELHSALEGDQLLEDDEEDPIQEDPEQSRFEEGIPLIAAEHSFPLSASEQTRSGLQFDDEDDEGDDGFFSKGHDQTRPVIERKETSEVMNGMPRRNGGADSPPLPQEDLVLSTAKLVAPARDLSKAFGDSDDADQDFAAVFGQTANDADDPWKSVMDDDEDFLMDDADDLLPDSDEEELAPLPPQQSKPMQSHQPLTRTNSNPFAPHQPTTAELSQFDLGYGRPSSTIAASSQRPNITTRAESFADQNKGGYKSPYDLPMDLAPKKRVQAQRQAPPVQAVPPPPRTSSMNTDRTLQSPFTPNTPTFNQAALASPPPVHSQIVQRNAGPPVKAPSQRSSSGFFEELPVIPKVRPTSQRVPAQQAPVGPPGQAHVPPSAPSSAAIATAIQASPSNPYDQFQLQPPSKLDPYSGNSLQPSPPSLAPVPPPMNARYSPAPSAGQNGVRVPSAPRYSPAPAAQPVNPRYSPAPPAQANPSVRYASQPVAPPNLQFQPRTSSPLAQHRKSVDNTAEQAQRPMSHQTTSSLPYNPSFAMTSTLSPPQAQDPVKQDIVPPRRSQTQSPSRQMARRGLPAKIAPPPNRPASAFGQLSPTRTHPPPSAFSPPRAVLPQAQSAELDFIKPVDGTEKDLLERYKGSPVFRPGFGGAVVSSFPIHTPRFSAAASRPQYKASPGEVKTRDFKSLYSLPEHVAAFPGPLKGKAKKKDVLTWLVSAVTSFEQIMMNEPSKSLEEKIALWKIVKVLVEQDGNTETPAAVATISAILMPDVYALENPTSSGVDGTEPPIGIYRPRSYTAKADAIDPVAVEKLRKTLLQGKREDAVWQAVDNRLWSHALLLASTLDRNVWKQVVGEFVKQEVKTIGVNADSLCALYEVLGGNTEESIDQLVPPSARAGLQMVSTVDTTGPIRNALDGLDRWKETVCLILNNRSIEDQRALITLARLLSDYGRIEAAHICYLLARSQTIPQMFGGSDEPSTMVVLLGADHRHDPTTFHLNTDSVLLTEVFEWATTTLPVGAPTTPMPHLAVYKLQRAQDLTDAGYKTEAQAYCDAILSGPGKNTKLSPYYHASLLKEAEELGNRLRQIPVPSASWMAKPSIEKVSGSVWNKFTSFVAGEDSDAESKGSARDSSEAGPFANVSGSPTLSRSGSQSDLYGSYPSNVQMTPAASITAVGSRYAPNGIHSAKSSSDMTRGRTSLDHQRSPPSTSYLHDTRNVYAPQTQINSYSPMTMSPPTSQTYQPSPAYQPSPEPHMPSVAEETVLSTQHSFGMSPGLGQSPVSSQENLNHLAVQPTYGGYTPSPLQFSADSHVPPAQSAPFEPTAHDSSASTRGDTTYGGYAPPEDTGYQPYVPEPDSDSEEKTNPKKKSFMDDDDEFVRNNTQQASVAQASNGGDDAAARKKANDDAADAAFRAAAEADAKQAKEHTAKKSGSWLGGWFGGGKRSDSLDGGAGASKKEDANKVHRVHLGESKMKLYYDKDKKKWINPDNPDASEKKALAPPPRSSTGSAPPMGPPTGPPRSVSTPYALPTGGISRNGTPVSQAVDTGSEGGDSRPGTGTGVPPPSGFAATLPPGTQQSLGLGLTPSTSNPPPRPASALSNASGLDDLLGGPPTGGRKVSGRGGAKSKKGRYVDVMAK